MLGNKCITTSIQKPLLRLIRGAERRCELNELFKITNEYLQVYDMLTDPEVDEQVVNDTLEALMGEIEVHAAGFVPVIERIDM